MNNIHPSVVFFNRDKIKIGNNVRIDCFCVISAGNDGIEIGDNVHIASAVQIFGSSAKVVIEEGVNLSPRSSLFTATDDFSEGYLIGPMFPEEYRKVRKGPVTLKKYSVVGCGSVVLPDVTIGIASSVGALSLVNRDVEDYTLVAGVPAKKIRDKNRELSQSLENKFRQSLQAL